MKILKSLTDVGKLFHPQNLLCFTGNIVFLCYFHSDAFLIQEERKIKEKKNFFFGKTVKIQSL